MFDGNATAVAGAFSYDLQARAIAVHAGAIRELLITVYEAPALLGEPENGR